MEQGEIISWSDTDKIDRVCRAHAQRHSTAQNNAQKGQDRSSSSKTTTCIYYNKLIAPTNRPMRQKGYCINMYVCHVGLRKVSPILTHKLNVVRVQKTISPGHDPGFESCP